jgi:hypothetical protein
MNPGCEKRTTETKWWSSWKEKATYSAYLRRETQARSTKSKEIILLA